MVVCKTNASIALVKEQAAAGNVAALASDVAKLQATKARHTPELDPPCAYYLAEKVAKANAEQQRDAARTALSNYRQSIFPTYETAINNIFANSARGSGLRRSPRRILAPALHAPTMFSSTTSPSLFQARRLRRARLPSRIR